MSNAQILAAIRSCARKLKRNPSLRDLRLIAGISEQVLYKHFGSLRRALEAAGLQPSGPGIGQQESTLLLDWAAVARKLGKLPSVHEYESHGRFSNMPFHTRYRRWSGIPDAFLLFARNAKLERKWRDVLKLITSRKSGQLVTTRARSRVHAQLLRGPVLEGRPVYGCMLQLPELAHAPTNESGVIFAFALVARRLGFCALRFQTAFPDCEALRAVAGGHLQRVHIEFEFESRNFVRHRHPRNGCDLIVCWAHNWPQCPVNIEVIELRKVLAGSQTV